jgi:PTS system mannose-specific IIA component
MIISVVFTLGNLGEALIETAGHIIGESVSVRSLSLDWGEDLNSARVRLNAYVADLNTDSGLLFLTDILGSTSTNLALEHYKPGAIEVVSGVNLPMIIKALTFSAETTLSEAAGILRNQGRKSILRASDLF